jgi:transcription antitermination factor NusG
MTERWYAVYTASRHEKHVSAQLNKNSIETYLPLYQTIHRRKNRTKAVLDLPLFPGYVFARMPLSRRADVLSTGGVFALVGSGREPWPLPDAEIEALRAGLDRRKAEPHAFLVMGDRARIRTGPLAGLEGVLLRKTNGLRVILTINEIGRSISVEVDAADLEMIEPLQTLAS